MIGTTNGLRLLAWLDTPRHFAAAYIAVVVVLLLALVGLAALTLLVLYRYRCALSALALSAALVTTQRTLLCRDGGPGIRPATGQHRVIRPVQARALAPVPLAAVRTAAAAAGAAEQAPSPCAAHMAPHPSTEQEIERSAEGLVAEAIRACRTASGGAR